MYKKKFKFIARYSFWHVYPHIYCAWMCNKQEMIVTWPNVRRTFKKFNVSKNKQKVRDNQKQTYNLGDVVKGLIELAL